MSVVAHLILFGLSWFLAFGAAYNFHFDKTAWFSYLFLPLLPLAVLAKVTAFGVARQFRASFRFVGLRDVISISYASWWSFVFILVIYYTMANSHRFLPHEPLFGEINFPDSVFLFDFAGTIALVCGARMAVRLYHEETRPESKTDLPRLLILGAGDVGANVLREILRMPLPQHHVVGFLDDDRGKGRTRIHGVEVLGLIDDIKDVC
ncbi:MAG: hypothetical protein IID33_06170, partial [Planctomycetes bacterium]|nr:hypothetical protein [Planctomycetota bacterium]